MRQYADVGRLVKWNANRSVICKFVIITEIIITLHSKSPSSLPPTPPKMSPPFDAWAADPPHPPHPSAAQQNKKPRHRHSPVQLAALNELFDQNEHPPLEQRTALADRLGMYVLFSFFFFFLLTEPSGRQRPSMHGSKINGRPQRNESVVGLPLPTMQPTLQILRPSCTLPPLHAPTIFTTAIRRSTIFLKTSIRP